VRGVGGGGGEGRRTRGEEVLWEKAVGFETATNLTKWYGQHMVLLFFFVEVVLFFL